MESVISKILWIESNSIIIKEILDIYKLSSENIIYESIGNSFFNEIKSIILKKSLKYEPNEKHLKLVILCNTCNINKMYGIKKFN